jgi:hypothetical protein
MTPKGTSSNCPNISILGGHVIFLLLELPLTQFTFLAERSNEHHIHYWFVLHYSHTPSDHNVLIVYSAAKRERRGEMLLATSSSTLPLVW